MTLAPGVIVLPRAQVWPQFGVTYRVLHREQTSQQTSHVMQLLQTMTHDQPPLGTPNSNEILIFLLTVKVSTCSSGDNHVSSH